MRGEHNTNIDGGRRRQCSMIWRRENIIKNCELVAGIPMPGGESELKSGGVRSLNLSVACGIVCYSACLQLNLLIK